MTADALGALREGGKPALARALARIERAPRDPANVALLDAALAAPRGLTLGLPGPPGVGKSSLIDALIGQLRARDATVAVIAVDPSSTRSGGAFLGDRARLSHADPLDAGVFFRSMASRGSLGGLSAEVFPALALMQALHDIVIVETVGVGQSETEVAGLVDTTVLCIQPASGDSIQFLKAGIMEVPDIAVITKSDLVRESARAAADLRMALSATAGGRKLAVHLLSSATGEGIAGIATEFLRRRAEIVSDSNAILRRQEQAGRWRLSAIGWEFGRRGRATAERLIDGETLGPPFASQAALFEFFDNRMKSFDDLPALGGNRTKVGG